MPNACTCTFRRGYAVPHGGLAFHLNGEESCLGREAVFCIVLHQLIFVWAGDNWNMLLQKEKGKIS